MNRYLTVKQAADIFGVTIQTIYRWVRAKKLRAKKIGRTIRFNAEDLTK